ncbi:cupin domain-containing protein [Shewanella aestuarii]|uniref:Cupin domain-containing protein n=1 Tax=Shewanella aestuarii TaxID=1028752 RepID=A0A6G9QKX0_9GAMM|nr:cupin domain-containing protein [Shewanella aestuarii]QIR14773.1 cupin domain-containing protein [Shewanella aestuarii]
MYQLTFDTQTFIKQHWQKKPVVLTQAFIDFIDPIAADELAGLACEEEISSRIVVTKKDGWDVIQGPFEDYDQYGESNWQLLVQAVNHWYPDAQPLVEAFRFLPDWRFDDLMVSFATPQGGVGPHIDNYDVFIIQGEGERRWRVGDIGNHRRRGGDANSPLVDDFEPIIDVVLKKGDVLYIPPGYPHCGETINLALSYSIGFRAPSQQELLTQLADSLIDSNTGHKRFTSINETNQPGLVSDEQQRGIMQLLAELASQPENYQTMLGKLLSQNRFELDICEGEAPLNSQDLLDAIEDGASINRIGGLKVLRLENDQQKRLFINGEVYPLVNTASNELELLANAFYIDNQAAAKLCKTAEITQFLAQLINQGMYYLTE